MFCKSTIVEILFSLQTGKLSCLSAISSTIVEILFSLQTYATRPYLHLSTIVEILFSLQTAGRKGDKSYLQQQKFYLVFRPDQQMPATGLCIYNSRNFIQSLDHSQLVTIFRYLQQQKFYLVFRLAITTTSLANLQQQKFYLVFRRRAAGLLRTANIYNSRNFIQSLDQYQIHRIYPHLQQQKFYLVFRPSINP